MLRRLISVMLFCFIAIGITTTGQAAERWQWINSNDECSLFVDTQTINYKYDSYGAYKNTKPLGAVVWVKYYLPSKEEEHLQQVYYDFNNNTYTMYSYMTYINGKLTDSYTLSSYERKATPIVPETFGEVTKNYLMKRVGM